MPNPDWLSLLAPLPDDVMPRRKPVASAEQLANGTAGPIAGWDNIIVNLSEPEFGLRHIQITLDAQGRLLAGGDYIMFVRETAPDGQATVTDHESIGGRFEEDGAFLGTHWTSTLESSGDDEANNVTRNAASRPPTVEEIAALRRIIDDVLERVRRHGR